MGQYPHDGHGATCAVGLLVCAEVGFGVVNSGYNSWVNLDTHELAWAAGFFDGEGTTSAVRQRHHKRPDGTYRYDYPAVHILISQNHDAAVLHRFKAAVSGIGAIYGPYDRKGSSSWVYNAVGFERSQAVIAMLWRWLGTIKREQAKRALTTYLAARPIAGVRTGHRLPMEVRNEREDVPVNVA